MEPIRILVGSITLNEGTAAANLQSRMQYTYTKSGLIGGLSYEEKDGKVRSYAYTYANDELPTKSTHPDGSNTQWTYDVLRRSTKTVFTPKSGVADGKKLYTTYAYQDGKHSVNGSTKTTTTGLVKTYTNKFGNSGSAVSKFDYTYDSWGNITKITDKASKNRTYTYNAYGEITKATEAYSNGKTTTYTYTYDAGGNIVKEQVGSTTHTYKYDSVWKDKLISYDGKSITYDEAGHPLNYMGTTMNWDVNNNLTNLTRGSTKISYTYQSTGERRSKTVNGTTTTYNYNNGLLISETKGNETLRYYYDSTGKVTSIGYQKGSAAEVGYFFARNGQGDIIAIYRSSDSKLIGTYEYDLWGRLISVKEASSGIDTNGILTKNPIRYRGYYYDNETGFYYLQSRYYDPSVRRWISPDKIEVVLEHLDNSIIATNLYAYCLNNPIVYFDPTGEFAISTCILIGVGIGVLIGGTAGCVYGYNKAEQANVASEDKWKYVVGYGIGGVIVGGVIGGFMGYGIGFLCGATSTSGVALNAISKGISGISTKSWGHIIVKKHLWNKVMSEVTQDGVKYVISQAMQKGTTTLMSTVTNNGVTSLVYESLYTYMGEQIVVHYAVVDGVIKISDAWVK